jgi:protein-disulfide isomerase
MKLGSMLKVAAALATVVFAAGSVHGQPTGNWLATVAETESGHRIGNPAAKVKLVEYVSYTCPHCAQFTRESDGALKLAYIAPGNVSVEIRHLIRDPVDLTAAMLANCGAASRFPQNHDAFMHGQDDWIGPLANPTQTQRQRWTTGDSAARRRAIAADFGFYRIMETRGYRRTEADRCLADEALAGKLAENSAAGWKIPGIRGTPSFAINGVVLPGTHAWAPLERQIKEFL